MPFATTGHLETDVAIWRGLRHPDIRRPIQIFLYGRSITPSASGIFGLKYRLINIECFVHSATSRPSLYPMSCLNASGLSPEGTCIWDAARKLWPVSLGAWTLHSRFPRQRVPPTSTAPLAPGHKKNKKPSQPLMIPRLYATALAVYHDYRISPLHLCLAM